MTYVRGQIDSQYNTSRCKEIYGDGMNLFRNESHSGEMKTVLKAESQAARTAHGSSLKLELYERINENIQTTIKITFAINMTSFCFRCVFYCLFTSRTTWKPFYRVLDFYGCEHKNSNCKELP